MTLTQIAQRGTKENVPARPARAIVRPLRTIRMRPIHRILVAVKSLNAASSPAVAKAAQLAQALHAELQLFHAITDTLYLDAYGLCDKSPTQIERETRDEAIDRLEAMAARLRRDDLKVTTAAEWDFPAYESVLRQAERWQAHLIVAEPHGGHRIAPTFLHLTDWELLRLSPVPVLVVKSAQAYRNPVVLAAVDPSHAFAKPSGLDREILDAADRLTNALRGELHAVHGVPAASSRSARARRADGAPPGERFCERGARPLSACFALG